MIFRWLLVAEQSFNPPFRRCYWLSFPHRHMSLGRSKISPSPTSSQMVSCCLTQSRLFGWSIHTSRNGWLVGDPHLLSSRPLLSSPLISSHVISSHHMSSHLISSHLVSSHREFRFVCYIVEEISPSMSFANPHQLLGSLHLTISWQKVVEIHLKKATLPHSSGPKYCAREKNIKDWITPHVNFFQ